MTQPQRGKRMETVFLAEVGIPFLGRWCGGGRVKLNWRAEAGAELGGGKEKSEIGRKALRRVMSESVGHEEGFHFQKA